MRFLAISGSARSLSTNTHLLRAMSQVAPASVHVDVFDRIGSLPVFSPDLEGDAAPRIVRMFAKAIGRSDGLIIASPEYARGIAGGLKNAIDWLVSGEELVGKPIVLAHASHRGDDMLAALRLVLSTVTTNFNADIFLRFALMKRTPDDIADFVARPENRAQIDSFVSDFAAFCSRCADGRPTAFRLD